MSTHKNVATKMAKAGHEAQGIACFFEAQLPGEKALSARTAATLFDLATEICYRKPWQTMGDTDLVLVKDPKSPEMCYCSVLGALGRSFAIHVYCGMDSYRTFKKIASGAPMSIGEYFAGQRTVSMEFVPAGELKTPDRELARAFGHPLKKGYVAPQFRAGRPGYRPWYPTEAEGKLLATCVDSVLAFCEHREDEPEARFWVHEDVYPQVFWKGKETFWVENVLVRVPPPDVPQPAPLDESRLAQLSRSDYPVRGIIELGEFYSGIPIGKKNERNACLRFVVAADAQVQYVYMSEAFTPADAKGAILAQGVLKTIEQHKFVPAEIRVRDEASQKLLLPLKERLGFELRVADGLPALDHAKKHLLEHMGDPGQIVD